jgi:Mg/Co/Ni transporter MgtE
MGMPAEGPQANATIRTLLHEVPVCQLKDDLAEVKSQMSDEWNISVVIDPERIVLGLLELAELRDYEGSIENVMKPAPRTLRPGVPIADAIHYFLQSDRTFALVTKSSGELMGAIRFSDLQAKA